MNLSNPFQMLMNMNMFNNKQSIPFNLDQFKTFIPKINDNMLSELVKQARIQGISEQDIEQGLNLIMGLRNN